MGAREILKGRADQPVRVGYCAVDRTVGPPCNSSDQTEAAATFPKWDGPHALISPSAGSEHVLGWAPHVMVQPTNPRLRTCSRRHKTLS
jgi:hypothetical protein